MSYIFKKGDRWYLQYRKRGKQYQRSLKTKDEWVARKLQLSFDKKGETGAKERGDVTFREAANLFLVHKTGTVTASSFRRFSQYSKNLQEFFTASVEEIDSEAVVEYQKHRQERGRSSKTIKEEILYLKGMLLWLVEEEMIEAAPVKKWPSIKIRLAKPETIGPYSSDEIMRLMEFFRGSDFYDVFVMAIFTGCRFGELGALRSSDYYRDEKTLCVRSIKSEGAKEDIRFLEVVPEVEKIISGRLSEEFIFPEMPKHSNNWGRRQMAAACKALGIQYRRFHGIRHSFGTHLLDSGASIMDTKEALGHSSITTTQKYLKFVQKKGQISRLPWAKKSE